MSEKNVPVVMEVSAAMVTSSATTSQNPSTSVAPEEKLRALQRAGHHSGAQAGGRGDYEYKYLTTQNSMSDASSESYATVVVELRVRAFVVTCCRVGTENLNTEEHSFVSVASGLRVLDEEEHEAETPPAPSGEFAKR
ncbi:hypothetical protein PHYPSEUDO_013983 [Phytophthora pseudosyringae]|uniref:Uncharacterized protein n=1 Tax=Phytophthora pseudosyringae TaxID=221518 RepID=A0A8T1W741_9STRA|nr:hypothetical protein PHYPSEUDO_013983 [Phytophthora pseudosyringae]